MDNNIKYYILSLLRENRKPILEKNIERFPCFEIIKSINGYDIDETLRMFKLSGLVYHKLYHTTYGSLANFLTKYNVLKHQIENSIPFVCFIEDDLELLDGFVDYIKDCVSLFNQEISIIRLSIIGNGYITSLNGAINIKHMIDKQGIISDISNQLRSQSENELYCPDAPWKLLIPCDKGDCLRTSLIKIEHLINRI